MNRSCLAALMMTAGVLAGCDDAVNVEDTDLVVVQAFLFAGEPVQDIRLTSTVPLGSDPDSRTLVKTSLPVHLGHRQLILVGEQEALSEAASVIGHPGTLPRQVSGWLDLVSERT